MAEDPDAATQPKLLGTFGTSRDVTEPGQIEAALRHGEIRLRAITDSALDAIVMMDPAGYVCYWNPAAERMLGYSSAEAMGQDLHGCFVPTRNGAAQRAAFPGFLETGRGPVIGHTRNLEARHKDDSRYLSSCPAPRWRSTDAGTRSGSCET